MVRAIETEDIDRLKEIHARFFEKEFSFQDFCSAWISNFVITDDNDEIITAGAIRPLMEIVAITDYNKSPRLRRAALYDMLEIAHYVLRRTNATQLHCFVQDEKWYHQLIKSGFKPCVGKPLYMNLGE